LQGKVSVRTVAHEMSFTDCPVSEEANFRLGSNSADGFNRLGNGYDRLASYVLAWKVSR
jgi:hypothetical protein